MLALQLHFADNELDEAFVAGINPGTVDKLLYIHLLGSRRLQSCSRYPMTEEQRFRYITLQDGLLAAVEQIHESHISLRNHEHKATTALVLIDAMTGIQELHTELHDNFIPAVLIPAVTAIGPWPEHERFFLTAH